MAGRPRNLGAEAAAVIAASEAALCLALSAKVDFGDAEYVGNEDLRRLATFTSSLFQAHLKLAEQVDRENPGSRAAGHFRDSLAHLPGWDSDHEERVNRVAAIAGAYEGGLIASQVIPDRYNDSEDPLPDVPGMASAYHIAAFMISTGIPPFYRTPISARGLRKWRFNLAASKHGKEPIRVTINHWTLEVTAEVNPIPGLLARLAQNGGNRRSPKD